MSLLVKNEPNYILVATSCAYAAPAIAAYLHNEFLLSQLCSLLIITSIQYHGNPSRISFLLDQFAIYMFVLKALYVNFTGFCGILAYAVFIHYGPYNHHLTHHPHYIIASLWHGSLHIIPAVAVTGHFLI